MNAARSGLDGGDFNSDLATTATATVAVSLYTDRAVLGPALISTSAVVGKLRARNPIAS
jgi:hypothetical protein